MAEYLSESGAECNCQNKNSQWPVEAEALASGRAMQGENNDKINNYWKTVHGAESIFAILECAKRSIKDTQEYHQVHHINCHINT